MSRTSAFKFATVAVTALAVMLAIVAVAARPAQATPDKDITCTGCHSGAPSGNVTAIASNASPSPGAAYTVSVNVGLAGAGKTGYHIQNTDAGGTLISWIGGVGVGYDGGPLATAGQTAWTANMIAPAAPGTYYYKVWGVKGYTGSASFGTYSITVAAPPQGDTTPPVTTATGATDGAWYKAAVNVHLSAADATGVDHIAYTLDGTPGTIAGASGDLPVSGDGPHTLSYQAVDTATPANTETLKSLSFTIDSVSPVAAITANANAKAGGKATIKYQVTDTPASGTAATVIKIKSKTGKVVKTLKAKATVGIAQKVTFKCKLAKGTYKVTAKATDKAGNVSAVSAAKKLTVK